MPGTPPTTPNLGLPRYDSTDRATFWSQINAIVDLLDTGVPKITDARLSDQRVPTDGSVVDAKVAANAAIQESKLNLASDATAGTPSRRTLGTGATQAAAGNDPRLSDARAPITHAVTHADDGADPVPGVVPIGSLIPYAGTALPTLSSGQPQRWAWADGTLINRNQYATFFSRVGHAYNGNVDPGTGTPGQGIGGSGPLVRLPDLRGRTSIGAINFGSGAAANDNLHAQYVRGAGGGEVNHLLNGLESGQKATGTVTTAQENQGHQHGIPWNTCAVINIGGYGIPPVGNQWGTGEFNWAGAPTDWNGNSHTHTFSLASTDASNSHNNVPPYQANNYLVRIA